MTLTELNQRFAIGNHVQFKEIADGMICVEVANHHALANIVLQGAHIATFQPRGEEPVIWLSPLAKFAPGKSIRGGVRPVDIARAARVLKDAKVKALIDDGYTEKRARELCKDTYATPPMVGHYARTGAFLMLPGECPEGEDARSVQAVIKRLPAATTDEILAEAEKKEKDQEWTFKALVKADKAHKKVKDQDDKDNDGNGDEDDTLPTKDALHYLTAATGSLTKACGMDDWTPEAVAAARALAEMLGTKVLAVEALASTSTGNTPSNLSPAA